MIETEYKVGDTAHLHFGNREHMLHDITNIGDTELGFVTVEFLDSENEPLPLRRLCAAAGKLRNSYPHRL